MSRIRRQSVLNFLLFISGGKSVKLPLDWCNYVIYLYKQTIVVNFYRYCSSMVMKVQTFNLASNLYEYFITTRARNVHPLLQRRFAIAGTNHEYGRKCSGCCGEHYIVVILALQSSTSRDVVACTFSFMKPQKKKFRGFR